MKKAIKPFHIFLASLYLSALVIALYFLVRGLDYYLTPLSLRPRHDDFRLFKPAGTWGLRFGIVGASLLSLLLLYSLRKRTKVFGSVFGLKYWLNVHIWCGIMGPVFILLHTSFKLGGLVAVSFWSMLAVAFSGVFGRYLYVQIPRNMRGDELSIRELEKQDEAYNAELREAFGLSQERVDAMMAMLQAGEKPLKLTLFNMVTGDLGRYWRLRKMTALLPAQFNIPRASAKILVATALKRATLRHRIARLSIIHKYFHYWHVIHRPFALVMYLIMIVHITVALMFGISWRAA